MKRYNSLSAYYQKTLDPSIIKKQDWESAFFFMKCMGEFYYSGNLKEKQDIEEAVESVFRDEKSRSQMLSIKRDVFNGIYAHYYEKIFNIYSNPRINHFIEHLI